MTEESNKQVVFHLMNANFNLNNAIRETMVELRKIRSQNNLDIQSLNEIINELAEYVDAVYDYDKFVKTY
jgi:hypothetical protein